MQTKDIDYGDGDVNLRGYLAFDEKGVGRRPGVLVFHEGLGLGDFAMTRARMLAEMGYVAFAADMFGERRQARNLQEVANLVGGLRSQPETLRARARAALATLAALPQVDSNRMAAIGFCFGARWCSNSRATALTLRRSSVFTARLQPKCRRPPAR